MAADAADGGEQQPGSGADGVGEDGGDTGGHGDHGAHRVDQPGRGQRDTDPVEQEGKSDVLLDAPVGGAACPVRPKHGAQVFVQGDDVGGLDGDVDAVADHRHPAAVGLKLADQVGLPPGRTPACTRWMPSWRAAWAAAVGSSPVTRTGSMRRRRSSAMSWPASARTWSPRPRTPTGRWPAATATTVDPACWSRW